MTPEARKKYRREWYLRNAETVRARTRARAKAKPREIRDTQLRYRYGLTIEQFEALIAAQDGKCALCTEPLGTKPHVDHDHVYGHVRAVLCNKCNVGLGFYERPGFAAAAAAYLKAHSRPLQKVG